MTKAFDAADELSKVVAREAKLKYPTSGHYAWEAGCLTSILKSIALNHPEILPSLQQEIEWHKKQLMCLTGISR